jgi:hypothetical protein
MSLSDASGLFFEHRRRANMLVIDLLSPSHQYFPNWKAQGSTHNFWEKIDIFLYFY